MKFAIRCREGKSYDIEFSARPDVQMIQLAPSTCQLDRIVYGENQLRLMSPFRLLRNEILDPGGVYYVGDFAASGTFSATPVFFYTKVRQSWRMSAIRDNYAEATASLKRVFPAFASVQTENRMTH